MGEESEDEVKSDVAPVWCVVANVREVTLHGEGGQDKKQGTTHFHAGAKVYCCPGFWGRDNYQITVVGHHRGKSLVRIAIAARHLTNWRVQMVYSPKVIALLSVPHYWFPVWDGSQESKDLAENLVAEMIKRDDELQGRRTTRQPLPSDEDSPKPE